MARQKKAAAPQKTGKTSRYAGTLANGSNTVRRVAAVVEWAGERLEGVVEDAAIASSDSIAPFGLPGRLTTSVRPRDADHAARQVGQRRRRPGRLPASPRPGPGTS